jgi:hypothetical protein
MRTLSESLFHLNKSVGFENYNEVNEMGYGLNALEDIKKDEIILKVNTLLGFISNELESNEE